MGKVFRVFNSTTIVPPETPKRKHRIEVCSTLTDMLGAWLDVFTDDLFEVSSRKMKGAICLYPNGCNEGEGWTTEEGDMWVFICDAGIKEVFGRRPSKLYFRKVKR